MKHRYDDPTLSAKEFLIEVMHDPSVPLNLRNSAAAILLPITTANDFPPRGEPAIVYRIADFRPQEYDHARAS